MCYRLPVRLHLRLVQDSLDIVPSPSPGNPVRWSSSFSSTLAHIVHPLLITLIVIDIILIHWIVLNILPWTTMSVRIIILTQSKSHHIQPSIVILDMQKQVLIFYQANVPGCVWGWQKQCTSLPGNIFLRKRLGNFGNKSSHFSDTARHFPASIIIQNSGK